jgi:K+-sensing histidine kinase KdpD
MTYTALGVYFIIYTFTTMYSTQVQVMGEHRDVILAISQTMLLSGTLMAIYPLWPLSIKKNVKELVINTWYPIAIFYMLVVFNSFFILVSDFSQLQFTMFSINIILTAILLGWRAAIIMISLGFYLGVSLYQFYFGEYNFDVTVGSPEFILLYITIIIGTIFVLFLKPKQEYIEETEQRAENLNIENICLSHGLSRQKELGRDNQELVHELDRRLETQKIESKKQALLAVGNGQIAENLKKDLDTMSNKVSHYNDKICDQEQEIARLGETSQRILNNLNHELRIPVGNVINFSEMLNESLEKKDDAALKDLSDEVYKNSTRLSTMIINMLDLAILRQDQLELQTKMGSLSELVEDRVKSCQKIYLGDKKIDIKMKLQQDILIPMDANYIRQVVDNLVINAIKFSKEGVITVTLLTGKDGKANLTIEDQGDGIPEYEALTIFDQFVMGSRHQSKAEGRGVGLALCKAAIHAHGGTITCKSDGKRGAKFTVVLG